MDPIEAYIDPYEFDILHHNNTPTKTDRSLLSFYCYKYVFKGFIIQLSNKIPVQFSFHISLHLTYERPQDRILSYPCNTQASHRDPLRLYKPFLRTDNGTSEFYRNRYKACHTYLMEKTEKS
jgi:hypothetical protein